MKPNAVVTKKQVLTEALFRLWVRPDARLTGFKAGQFVDIGLPGAGPDGTLLKRPYSLASGEDDTDLELYIRLVPEGALTPKLLALEAGARVWLDERFHGVFTLDAARAGGRRELVFVATGTGLAPFVAMLRSEVHRKTFTRIVVLHGTRLPGEHSYDDEIARLAALPGAPRIETVPSCTRPRAEDRWEGLVGRIPDLFASGAIAAAIGPLDAARQHFMLCGNPMMIVATEAWLLANGHKKHRKRDPGNVQAERFW